MQLDIVVDDDATVACASPVSDMQVTLVNTPYGQLGVCVHGDPAKCSGVILTYHDIGLTSDMCFSEFFHYPGFEPVMQHFCVLHVHAPGHEPGAEPLAEEHAPQSLEQMGLQLDHVLTHFNVRQCIAFGVGAGADVVIEFAIAHPKRISSLILVSPTPTKVSWSEWMFWRKTLLTMGYWGATAAIQNDFIYRFFDDETSEVNVDLMTQVRQCIVDIPVPNVSAYVRAYLSKADRTQEMVSACVKPTLLCVGRTNAYLSAIEDVNMTADKRFVVLMEVEDSRTLLTTESPGRVAEAVYLHLRGSGHALPPTSMGLQSTRPDF